VGHVRKSVPFGLGPLFPKLAVTSFKMSSTPLRCCSATRDRVPLDRCPLRPHHGLGQGSAPLIAKLVRHLARCANGVQCGGDDASTSKDIHALLRWVWVDDGPFRKQAPYSDSLSVPGEVEQDL